MMQDEILECILGLEYVIKKIEDDTSGNINSKQLTLLGGLMKNMVNQLPVRAAHLKNGQNRNTTAFKF